MKIIDRYNQAKFTTVCGKEQKALFSWWSKSKDKPMLALDTETTSLKFGLPSMLCVKIVNHFSDKGEKETPPYENYTLKKIGDLAVFGISMAVLKNDKVYCYWGRLGSPLFKDITKLMKVTGPKCFHNSRFDIRACAVSNIELVTEVECTYSMSRIYWDRRKKHSLDSLTEFLCPEISSWKNVIPDELKKIKKVFKKADYPDDYVNYSFVDDGIMGKYAMTDTFMALMLWYRLQEDVLWT